VADFFALVADEVDSIDALVDFFPIEHAAPELIDADAQELFVVLFDLAPAGFVTGKIFVFRFFVRTIVDVVVSAIFARPSGTFLFWSRHFSPCRSVSSVDPDSELDLFHNERSFYVNTIPTLEIKTRKADDPPTFRVNLTTK